MSELTMTAGQTQPEGAKQGLSLRSVFYGVLATVFLCVSAVYTNMVLDGYLAASATHVGVVVLFAALVFLANMAMRGLANLFGPRKLMGRFFGVLKLSGAELVTVYLMMLAASAVTTLGLMLNLITAMASPAHFADDGNVFSYKIMPHISPLMVPYDPRKMSNVESGVTALEPEQIKWLYNGMPENKTFWDIPWGVWVRPLAVWMVLILALYWSCYCLMAMLRKQWVERERLQFPLVQLPMAMVEGADVRKGVPAFFRDKIMWLGFAIPMVFVTWNCLAQSFPLLSAIQGSWPISMFNRQLNFTLEPVNFPVIGFTYLVKTEVAFSLWTFCLIGLVVGSTLKYFNVQAGGIDMHMWRLHEHPWATHAAFGGVLGLGLLALWAARRGLFDVVRKAVGRASDVDDRDELLSYPVAFWGFLGGLTVMTAWMTTIAGMSLWVAVTFLVVAFLCLLAATRMIAEGGLMFVQLPLLAPSFMFRTIGQTVLGASNLVGMAWMSSVWLGDIRVIMMPAMANSMKLVDAARLKRRQLVWVITLAVALGIVVSAFMVLWVAYTQGGGTTQSGPFAQAWLYFRNIGGYNIPTPEQAAQGIEAGERLYASRRVAAVVGVGIMLGLTFLRNRFLWWPFHPLGLPFSMMPGMQRIWAAIAVGWLIKVVILRYGGAILFRKLRPFFLGLILGQFVTAGLWYLIYFFSVTYFHGTGYNIYN